MIKPTIFIGSSPEGLEAARVLQMNLSDEADAVIWSGQAFSPKEYIFDSLFRSLDKVDFAILILTPDDLVKRRGGSDQCRRDNLIFSLGLIIGRLGRSRTFIVMKDDDSSMRLPTDLSGIMVAKFKSSGHRNLSEALIPAFRHIRDAIRQEHYKRSEVAVEQYSCFISYNSQDKEFAEQIYNDLKEVGIRCWLDSKDLRIGDPIELQINRAIQLTDKVLLILSEASVTSEWVRREINTALSKESQTKKTILFPIRIDNAVMAADNESFANLVKSKHIGNFTEWSVPDAYRRAFSRLVKDLTVSAAAEQDRRFSNA